MNNASPTSKAGPGEQTPTSIFIPDLNRVFLTKETVSERELMLASISEGCVCLWTKEGRVKMLNLPKFMRRGEGPGWGRPGSGTRMVGSDERGGIC
jgi:hypothetical protein